MDVIRSNGIDWKKWEQNNSDTVARIRPLSDYKDEVVEWLHGNNGVKGRNLPWTKMQGQVGIRSGEMSVWAGVSGHGKSLMLGQVALSMAEQGDRFFFISPEMSIKALVSRLAKQAICAPTPSEDLIDKFLNWSSGKGWVYDQMGVLNPKRVVAICRYINHLLGGSNDQVMTHIVIDNLMKCVPGTDNYNAQKDMCNELFATAKDTGMHIHLIAHCRKMQSEDLIPSGAQIHGASEIVNIVDNVFITWRNKPKEKARSAGGMTPEMSMAPDGYLVCEKQRHGDYEETYAMWFHRQSEQYIQADSMHPMNLVSLDEPKPDWTNVDGYQIDDTAYEDLH